MSHSTFRIFYGSSLPAKKGSRRKGSPRYNREAALPSFPSAGGESLIPTGEGSGRSLSVYTCELRLPETGEMFIIFPGNLCVYIFVQNFYRF